MFRNVIFKSILRQIVIFFIYLIINSLLLFNHSGGADILFSFTIFLSIFIHLIFLISKLLNQSSDPINRWGIFDLFTLMFIIVVFYYSFSIYMDFMWWFTHTKGFVR
jgi:hypothetical protein